MGERRTYNTEQRQLILKFLKNNCGEAVTMRRITDELKLLGVGRSTVYRQMEKLLQEGMVSRHIDGKNREYSYMFCGVCSGHYHLKCTSCGKLVHLDSDASRIMQSQLNENGFEISEAETILWGKCKECKVNE